MIPRQTILWLVFLTLIAVAIGILAWQMSDSATPGGSTIADNRPVAAPVAGPRELVNLYVAYDDPGMLRSQATTVPLPTERQQRAQELLRALLNIYLAKSSPHPLAPEADIRSVYLIDPGIAVIDLNSAFADGHRSGVLVEEELTVASLVETLVENVPGISRVKILVEGKDGRLWPVTPTSPTSTMSPSSASSPPSWKRSNNFHLESTLMFYRSDSRRPDQLRPVNFIPDFINTAEGSVLIEVGNTRVICTASIEETVPAFMRNQGKGWISSEYAMLPRATLTRSPREVSRGRQSGRTHEIQRLIGRSCAPSPT